METARKGTESGGLYTRKGEGSRRRGRGIVGDLVEALELLVDLSGMDLLGSQQAAGI